MKKRKGLVFMIAGIITLVIAIVGSTYAWYAWSTSEEEETKIATDVGVMTVKYDGGASLKNQKIRPVANKTSGLIKAVTVSTNTGTANMNLYLDIDSLDEGLKDSSFKYEFYKGNTLVKSGSFTNEYLNSNTENCTVNSGKKHIVLLSNASVTTTTTNYLLYIWIDGTMENPNTMQNKNFSFNLHATGTNAILKEAKLPDISSLTEGTAAYMIANKYATASKSLVINNEIKYYYAQSLNLMSDVGGNTRYYGANPNNYIYFNCSDYANQSTDTCELWRIIGVFGDKLKIIRRYSIGNLAWDYDKNIDSSKTTYDNNWETASLQLLLNNQYYEGKETVTYYSGNGSPTVTLNMANIGLKNDSTRNKIAEVTWNLGGWNSTSIYSDQIYGYERGTEVYSGRPTVWTGKIALMYTSDYGYAADLMSCWHYLYSYDNSICYNNDWLFNSGYQWFLTSRSSNSSSVQLASSLGFAGSSEVKAAEEVRPVLYLSSDQVIESGDGSLGAPYMLGV